MNSIPAVLLLTTLAGILNLHQCQNTGSWDPIFPGGEGIDSASEIGYPSISNQENGEAAAAVCVPQPECNYICYPYTAISACSPPYTMAGCFCQLPNSDCPTRPPRICYRPPQDCTRFCWANNYTGSAVCDAGGPVYRCMCYC